MDPSNLDIFAAAAFPALHPLVGYPVRDVVAVVDPLRSNETRFRASSSFRSAPDIFAWNLPTFFALAYAVNQKHAF